MIKKSRIVSLVLAFMMVVSCFNVAFAVQIPQKTVDKVQSSNANEKISVIIELEDKPLLDYVQAKQVGAKSFLDTNTAKDIKEKIVNTQETVQNQILNTVNSDITFKYSYTNTLNGFAAEIQRKDIAKIRAIPGVKRIYIDKVYDIPTPQMSTSNDMINAPDVWNIEGLKGEGRVIAVIDSGVDVNHELMVLSDSTDVKIEEENIASVISRLNASDIVDGLSAEDVYYNRKFPYCFDYADNDANANADSNDHGVHVSGTVGANGTVANEINDDLHTNIIFNGVAPESQILGMKVFSSKGGGAKTSNIIAAVEDAIVLGADAMNLSLGSAAGFTFYEGEDLVEYEYEYSFKRARDAGIIVAVAAGNDNRIGEQSYLALAEGYVYPTTANVDSGLLGSPSSKYHATSVASMENISIVSEYVLGPNNKKILFSDTSSTYTPGKVSFVDVLDGGTYEYVNCGLGQLTDFDGLDLTGKIALISRGSISFYEKVNNAAAAGAIGCVIYNNAGNSDILSMNLTGVTTNVPAVAIARADGLALQDAETKQISVSSSFNEISDNNLAYQMSDFTSWGCTPDLKLKPEITAPGGQIYSTLPNNKYGMMSGTSMATPHVAGASAIMQQYVNSDDKFAGMTSEEKADIIEALLMSTAKVAVDPDGSYYSPRRQGAGLMDLYAAVNSDVYLMNEESGKAKVELFDNIGDSFNIEFDIINLSDTETYSYELYGSLFSEYASGIGVENFYLTLPYALYLENSEMLVDGHVINTTRSVTTGSAITGSAIVSVAPNSTTHVNVSVNLDDVDTYMLNQVFNNGAFVEGFVELLSLEDQPDLSIPYMGFYGDWTAAPTVDGSYYYDSTLNDFYYYKTSYAYDYAYDENGDPYEYYRLGHNGIYDYTIKDYTDYNYNWISFSPNGDGYLDAMGYRTNFLRNVKSLIVDIYDSNGQLVTNLLDDIYYTKTYYYANGGYLTTDDLPLWDGTDADGQLVSDGQYKYVIKTLLDYPGAEYESKEIPVMVDNEKPVLVEVNYNNVDSIVTISLKDNGYINYVHNTDSIANAVTLYIPETPAKEYSFSMPMSRYSGKYTEIYVVDCAGNEYQEIICTNPNGLTEPIVVLHLDGGNINGNTEDIELILDENGYVQKPADPVKEGYNFIGWYDNLDEEYFDFTKPVSRLTYLTAIYEAKISYDVTFDLNGGNISGNTDDVIVEVAENGLVTQPANPVKEGYNFIGWFEGDATTAFDFTTQITSDITLVARYEEVEVEVTYDVTFDLNGGNIAGDTDDVIVEVVENGLVTQPANPVKEGYNFIGWFEGDETTGFDFETPITNDITLTAKYEEVEVTYNVTFDLDGGNINGNTDDVVIEVAENGLVQKPLHPKKDGYYFIGWFEDGATTSFNFTTPITSDLTLTARYEEITYDVTFDLDGGNIAGNTDDVVVEVVENGLVTKPADPVKEGYNFIGWFEGDATTGFDFETPITNDITLTAKYEEVEVTYEVTFDLDGGNIAGNTDDVVVEVVENGLVTKPADPIKAGYNFIGWFEGAATTSFDFTTPIIGDLTLTAKYEEVEVVYNVTFDLDGGNIAGNTDDVVVEVAENGLVIKPADPVKEGYNFIGWFEGESTTAFDFTTPIASDLTLTARYEEVEVVYNVTFDLDGGNIAGNADDVVVEVAENGLVTQPANPVKEGYNFIGWFEGDATTAFDFTTPITSDLTLTARYEEITYEVTFDLNGGNISGNTDDVIVKVAVNGLVTKPADPNKSGYNFAGWFEGDATTAFDFTTPITKDLTLTAKFKVIDSGSGGSPSTPSTPTTPVSTEPVKATLPNTMMGIKLDNNKAQITIDKNATSLIKDGKSDILSISVDNINGADDFNIIIPAEVVEILVKNNMTIELSCGNLIKFIITVDKKGELIIEYKLVESFNTNSEYTETNMNYDINIKQNGNVINNSNNLVKVELYAEGLNDINKAGVYTLDENGNIEYVMTYLNGNVLSFYPPHFSPYSVMIYEKTFKDIKGHWAQEYIEDMASKQIVKGKTNEIFAPEDTITRAEFVTMVVRALGLKGEGKSKIANIDKTKWYANYILLAKDAGLIEGENYNAEGIISRIEMAKIISKAHAILNGTTVKFEGKIKFTDIVDGSDDAKYIGYANENGLINGFPGDLFMPVENTTRAQAMKVIHKLVNK